MSPGWRMLWSLSFHIQFVTFAVCFIVMCCIAEILNLTDLPEPTKRDELVAWYPWTINNKYYTADVTLCVVPSTFQMSSEIAQSMQAFIAYFDSSEVRQWLPGCCLWAVYYCCRVGWDPGLGTETNLEYHVTGCSHVLSAEGWLGKAESMDTSGERSFSRGAHSGVRQGLRKRSVV